MKKTRPILFILFLLIIYVYVASITMLPSHIILFEGENIKIPTLLGIKIKTVDSTNLNLEVADTIETAINLTENKINQVGQINLSVNLFDKIPLKQIDVDVIKKSKVIPLGNAIGLKLYTKGVMVVGMSEIEDENKNKFKPYENTGIEEGDMIIEVNEKTVENTDELIKTVNESNGEEIEVKYIRDEETMATSIIPAKISENEYKLGLWVRDAAAGVGTLTFYEPETGNFCALGHAITDVDTGEIVNIANGELMSTDIVSITKGQKGVPGQIKGTIENGNQLGNVEKNTALGIYGNITQVNKLNISSEDEMEVALREEIQEGDAQIICQLEDGKKEKYNIKIEKIYLSNSYDNKSMLIKITDDRLIEKTGGIIQGMSGSPVIQNGKFVGAVTHVLVQNPTEGYAVFADMLIKQMREVE